MKVALFSLNASFFTPIQRALKEQGHELRIWQKQSDDWSNGYVFHELLEWCDVAWLEFLQSPLDRLLNVCDRHPDVLFVARMHRIEMYNNFVASPIDLSKIDILFASADHVIKRFLEKRSDKPKPKDIVFAPTNIIDTNRFSFTERSWDFPLRICMVGNFVPKKRQYTAIQYMRALELLHPGKFKLDILGSKGKWSGYGNSEYYQNCKDLIDDLDLASIVTIYDRIDHSDMPDFMGRENMILSNSNEEGTHVSIAEASCTGCIPLCNMWRGAKEVYPPELAYHFGCELELTQACEDILKKCEDGTISEHSKTMSETAVGKYGDQDAYNKIIQVIHDNLKKGSE
jgi:glycosyltransferase involved in cell wall biosynthesis